MSFLDEMNNELNGKSSVKEGYLTFRGVDMNLKHYSGDIVNVLTGILKSILNQDVVFDKKTTLYYKGVIQSDAYKFYPENSKSSSVNLSGDGYMFHYGDFKPIQDKITIYSDSFEIFVGKKSGMLLGISMSATNQELIDKFPTKDYFLIYQYSPMKAKIKTPCYFNIQEFDGGYGAYIISKKDYDAGIYDQGLHVDEETALIISSCGFEETSECMFEFRYPDTNSKCRKPEKLEKILLKIGLIELNNPAVIAQR